MKKIFRVLLVAAVIMSVAFGCASGSPKVKTDDTTASTTTDSAPAKPEATDSEASDKPIMSAPGELPIVDEVVQLKVLTVPSAYVEDYDTNYANKWLEEQTNVDVIWTLLPPENSYKKIDLLLAANNKNEMPDVFYTEINRITVEAYGARSVLVPLENYIKDYGLNMQLLFERQPALENQMKAFDGHIYFLSRYNETVHARATQKLWMDMSWLERLGLEVPVTTNDFYDVLKAFKEQDANGNGDPNDEIPFIVYAGGYNSNNFGCILNAFTYYPNAIAEYVEDGKIMEPYMQDGFRDGLKYLKVLYDEQLLNEGHLLMKAEQAKTLADAEKGSRIGSVQGGNVGIFDVTDPKIFDFEVIEPLTGPSGLKQTPLEPFNAAPFFMITSCCEIPEIAYRWADAQFYDCANDIRNGDFTWLNYWYGEEGIGWEPAAAGAKSFTGEKAYYKLLFNWGETTNTHIYETFLNNMPESWKTLVASDIGGGYNQDKILYESTIDRMLPYAVDKTMPTLSLTEEEAKSIMDIKPKLGTYISKCLVDFMRGEMDLDKDWDSFQQELKSIGVEKVISIYQTAYDRTFK
jgi:putative aldouronate transport system substrate-binding protein